MTLAGITDFCLGKLNNGKLWGKVEEWVTTWQKRIKTQGTFRAAFWNTLPASSAQEKKLQFNQKLNFCHLHASCHKREVQAVFMLIFYPAWVIHYLHYQDTATSTKIQGIQTNIQLSVGPSSEQGPVCYLMSDPSPWCSLVHPSDLSCWGLVMAFPERNFCPPGMQTKIFYRSSTGNPLKE